MAQQAGTASFEVLANVLYKRRLRDATGGVPYSPPVVPVARDQFLQGFKDELFVPGRSNTGQDAVE